MRCYSLCLSFESSIEKNDSLTAVDKVNYLIKILEGEAFRMIQGVEIVEENYEHAKKTLQQCFGHKQRIIQAHMDSLLKLQYSPNVMISHLTTKQSYKLKTYDVRNIKSSDTCTHRALCSVNSA